MTDTHGHRWKYEHGVVTCETDAESCPKELRDYIAALEDERDAYREALERIERCEWRSSQSLTDIASAALAAYRQSHPEETR